VSLDDVLKLAVEQGAQLLRGGRSVLMLTDDDGLEPFREAMTDRLQGLLIDDGQ